MVEFKCANTGNILSYSIDGKLKAKWDKIRKGKLAKEDDDRVYIVDGRERSGKSLFTIQQAKYIDPSFDVHRICFTPDDFLHQIRTAPKGSVIVFDEAFRGLSSKGSQSKTNKKLVTAMMEMGQNNLIVFIVLPTIFLLEIYAAVLRSDALFHVYKTTTGKRAFRLYNRSKKSQLYFNGKKKGFSYAFPKVRLNGRFYKKYPIDEQAYRKKKKDSLVEFENTNVEENNPVQDKFKKILVGWFKDMKEKENISQKAFCEYIKSVGIEMTQQNLSLHIKSLEKERKNTENTGFSQETSPQAIY